MSPKQRMLSALNGHSVPSLGCEVRDGRTGTQIGFTRLSGLGVDINYESGPIVPLDDELDDVPSTTVMPLQPTSTVLMPLGPAPLWTGTRPTVSIPEIRPQDQPQTPSVTPPPSWSTPSPPSSVVQAAWKSTADQAVYRAGAPITSVESKGIPKTIVNAVETTTGPSVAMAIGPSVPPIDKVALALGAAAIIWYVAFKR